MARLGQVQYLNCSTQIENVTNAQALKTKKKAQNTGSLLVGRPVNDHITRMKCLFLCANSPHLLAPMEGAQQDIVRGSYDYVLCIRSLSILRYSCDQSHNSENTNLPPLWQISRTTM